MGKGAIPNGHNKQILQYNVSPASHLHMLSSSNSATGKYEKPPTLSIHTLHISFAWVPQNAEMGLEVRKTCWFIFYPLEKCNLMLQIKSTGLIEGISKDQPGWIIFGKLLRLKFELDVQIEYTLLS